MSQQQSKDMTWRLEGATRLGTLLESIRDARKSGNPVIITAVTAEVSAAVDLHCERNGEFLEPSKEESYCNRILNTNLGDLIEEVPGLVASISASVSNTLQAASSSKSESTMMVDLTTWHDDPFDWEHPLI